MNLSKSIVLIGTLVVFNAVYAQEQTTNKEHSLYFNAEVLLGITAEPNEGYPDRGVQNTFFVNLGRQAEHGTSEWSKRLKQPTTGVSLGYSNFGNNKDIGHAFMVMPFLKFPLFTRKSDNFDMLVGFGGSYFNKTYNIETNPFNKGVSTGFNWSYRSFIYYKLIQKERFKLKFGLGYVHNSNGHTQLPNQGLNSFLGSLSATIGAQKKQTANKDKANVKSSQVFFSARFGIGQNAFSEIINDRKEVFTYALSVGKIYHKTFKIGLGVYYRFYENYYDYIINNERLVQEPEYAKFKTNPNKYASNIGIFGNAELLLGHVGLGLTLGINLYKPFYEIEWKDSQGFFYQVENANGEIETRNTLEPLSDYYKIKKTVSGRLGLKYYLVNTNKSPRHNVFLAAHINANLGQADFSELSIGYLHCLNFKIKE
jgi:hypothetical protein